MYEVTIRESVCRAGVDVFVFDMGTDESGHRFVRGIAKPILVEFEGVKENGPFYYGDREPTLKLSYEAVYRDRVFDQVVEALARAGLRPTDNEVRAELKQLEKSQEREQEQHDRLFTLFEHTVQQTLLPPDRRARDR